MKTIKELEADMEAFRPIEDSSNAILACGWKVKALKDVLGLINKRIDNCVCDKIGKCKVCEELKELRTEIEG